MNRAIKVIAIAVMCDIVMVTTVFFGAGRGIMNIRDVLCSGDSGAIMFNCNEFIDINSYMIFVEFIISLFVSTNLTRCFFSILFYVTCIMFLLRLVNYFILFVVGILLYGAYV